MSYKWNCGIILKEGSELNIRHIDDGDVDGN